MLMDVGEWRNWGAFIPLSFQKRGNEGGGAFSSIGIGAGKFSVVRGIVARIFPNFPEKFLCKFCLQIFSLHFKSFFGVTSKMSSCVFLQILGAIF